MSSVKEALKDYFPEGIQGVTLSKLKNLIGLIDDGVIDQLIQRKKNYLNVKKSKESNMEGHIVDEEMWSNYSNRVIPLIGTIINSVPNELDLNDRDILDPEPTPDNLDIERVALRRTQTTMKYGDIHQVAIGNFPGWEDLGKGHETECDLRKLDNKPLIYFPIIAALKSKYIGHVLVSTDSKKIANVAKKNRCDSSLFKTQKVIGFLCYN